MSKNRKKNRGAKAVEKKSSMICDPGTCDECMYIGEGDFLCDKYQEIVVSDWIPTESYLMCIKGSAT